MFKKNTAVANFPIGAFIQTADGAQKTTGTPTGAFSADGVVGALTGSASYDGTAGCWVWSSVQAAAMNGDIVGLVFNLADCLPVVYVIRTSTKLVSELNDLAQSSILTDATPSAGGNIDAAISGVAVPGDAMALTGDYDAAKTAAQAGDAMALTGDYDAAKTAAQAGDAMALTEAEREAIDTQLSSVHGDGSWEGGGGAPTVAEIRAEMHANSTQLAAIKAKTDLLGTTTVAVVSPVRSNGDAETIRGDSYLNADGRRLSWTVATWNIAATSTIVIVIHDIVAFTGVRISATSVGLELTGTQTASVPENKAHKFSVQEYKVGATDPITHLQGNWESKRKPDV